MDVERAPKFRALNRSLLIAALLSALLAASVGWNVWYYRLEQKRRTQAQAEERASKSAVSLANEKAAQARLKRRSRDAKSVDRIQQLYEEIDHLTRVGEESIPLGKSTRNENATADGSAKKTSVR